MPSSSPSIASGGGGGGGAPSCRRHARLTVIRHQHARGPCASEAQASSTQLPRTLKPSHTPDLQQQAAECPPTHEPPPWPAAAPAPPPVCRAPPPLRRAPPSSPPPAAAAACVQRPAVPARRWPSPPLDALRHMVPTSTSSPPHQRLFSAAVSLAAARRLVGVPRAGVEGRVAVPAYRPPTTVQTVQTGRLPRQARVRRGGRRWWRWMALVSNRNNRA